MLARLQQGIVLGLLLLVAAWLWWSRSLPWIVAFGGLLALALAHALFLALEFALAHRLNRDDPAPRADAAMLVRAWLLESVVAPRVFLWQQPLRWNRWPDATGSAAPAAARGRTGVVFIHGFVCNRGLWNPWLQRLQAAGRAYAAVNLEPVFGSIDAYTAIVEDAVSRVAAATERPPLLVCHSMGGLAARAWLRAHGADARVAAVVTLGTPHHGTWLARLSHLRNGRQMQRGSRWLAQLQRDEPPQRLPRFTCYYSNCDNIVLPASTAMLAGADNRFIAGVPHVAMAFDARIMDAVLDRLQALDDRAA